ncbi:MAG: branched-chain amino acid transport system substrate-binding protein [Trebonia sp.]|nr:branched-chain amino acid transport system substrate-binding protein [Trebonia sp.]
MSAGSSITVGADLPLSGTFAFFGGYQKWGYDRAVSQVNARGGILIDGKKHKVKLVILDDASNPETATSNVHKLISHDGAVAILGSCTPPMVTPGAVVAEHSSVPMVTGCDPIATFEATGPWKWVWDIFFDDPDLAVLPFQTMQTYRSVTNKKIAILYSQDPDGNEVGGALWPKDAKAFGYQVVASVSFPDSATDFAAAVEQAKSSGAQIVLVDCDTPQAIAIRQQMAASNYTPKVLDIEKGSEPFGYSAALKGLASGTLVGGYWSPTLPFPGTAALAAAYRKETGNAYSQHIADSYAAAQVLLQAVARAGSTSNTAINNAIGQTNGLFVVGRINFAGSDLAHAAALGVVELQWQNGKTVEVWPRNTEQDPLLFPVPQR